MRKPQQPALLKYDTRDVPSKKKLKSLQRLGMFLVLACFGVAAYLIGWFFSTIDTYYSREFDLYYRYEMGEVVEVDRPTGWLWLIPLALLIAGCVLRTVVGDKLYTYHEYVRQGVIIQKDNFGGWLLEGIQWTVTIKGNTYGNEVRYYRHDVPAGDWLKYENGQVVDFGD